MNTIHDALTQRIAADLGKDFLIRMEERLTAKFSASNSYIATHFGSELKPMATGQLQHLHILEEVVSTAFSAGLAASMTPTSPKGHYYAKIETECFVLGCMRMKSESWAQAKYSRELGRMNEALEPLTGDLFEAIQSDTRSEKIFLVAAVIEDAVDPEVPQIYFDVPYSTLNGFHFRAHLKEILIAADQGVQKEALEPLPFLKKRLDDIESSNKKA